MPDPPFPTPDTPDSSGARRAAGASGLEDEKGSKRGLTEGKRPAELRHAAILATALLVVASYAFRLPPLLNARSTNSDAAIVGLQAMHLLRGEMSLLLWGSGYQTAADSAVAAAWFAAFGASPLVLMLSALTLHVALTLLVSSTLRRRFAPFPALLLSLPLVVCTSAVHSYALYPPRQASLTLALAAFWAIDGADVRATSKGRWLALGGACATLAVSADPYPMLLVPLSALHATLVAWTLGTSAEGRAAVTARLRAFGAFAAGAVAGLVPFVVIHRMAGAKSGPMGLTFDAIPHHLRLLREECLPWALGYKVYYAHHVMDYRPWDAPAAFTALGILGALALAGLVAFGLLAPALAWAGHQTGRVRARIDASTLRLGFVAAVGFPLTIAAFLVSVMVMDHFSMRYLAVLTLLAPFAIAPAAAALGARRTLPLLAPHLLATAIAGWVGYGPFVRGALPVRETPELRDDFALEALLHARGVTYAEADYWTAYRLTFLFRERVVVVPTNPGEDRYPPYRRGLESARLHAYVYDPGRSREDPLEAERRLLGSGDRVEKTSAGALTVWILERR